MFSIDKLLQIYVDASIKHGEGTETGNYKLANKSHSILQKTYQELKNLDNGKAELLKLLDHPNDSVRLWASWHILDVYPNEAKEVLLEISKKVKELPLISFSAKMTLSEWEKGNLKF